MIQPIAAANGCNAIVVQSQIDQLTEFADAGGDLGQLIDAHVERINRCIYVHISDNGSSARIVQ